MNSIFIGINVIKRSLYDINSINFLIIFPILAALIVFIMFGGTGVMEIGITNEQEDDGLVEYINNSDKYNVQIFNEGELEQKIQNREIKAGIEFTALNQLKLIALKSDPEIHELRGFIEMYMSSVSLGVDIKQEEVSHDNKDTGSKMGLSIMAMFIIVFAGNGIGLLLEDKRLKTFARTFCTPIKQYEAVLGYMMANMALGIVQIIVFLFFTTFLFNIDWEISVLNVFILLLIYMIGAIGLAIGLAGFISDSTKYTMILMLTGVVTSFIGGSFFPIENLNSFIQRISIFTPQKWLMDSFDVLADGGSFSDIQMNILILLLFAIVMFSFGLKVLKPNFEDL